jgi:hypothetical protein
MSLDRARRREFLTGASTALKSSLRDGVRYSEREEIRA